MGHFNKDEVTSTPKNRTCCRDLWAFKNLNKQLDVTQCSVVGSYLLWLESGISCIDTALNRSHSKICLVQNQLRSPSTLHQCTSSAIVGNICWRVRARRFQFYSKLWWLSTMWHLTHYFFQFFVFISKIGIKESSYPFVKCIWSLKIKTCVNRYLNHSLIIN